MAKTPAARITAIADAIGLSLEAKFVPFSHSRNATPRHGQKEPWKSINWRVSLMMNGRAVIESDYSQGVGHAPADKGKWSNNRHLKARAVDIEIESGFCAEARLGNDEPRQSRRPLPPPSLVDVLSSFAMDAGAIDFSSFEDWAGNYGYDADSRSAEDTYRQCLAIALALRSAVGEGHFAALREASGEL